MICLPIAIIVHNLAKNFMKLHFKSKSVKLNQTTFQYFFKYSILYIFSRIITLPNTLIGTNMVYTGTSYGYKNCFTQEKNPKQQNNVWTNQEISLGLVIALAIREKMRRQDQNRTWKDRNLNNTLILLKSWTCFSSNSF